MRTTPQSKLIRTTHAQNINQRVITYFHNQEHSFDHASLSRWRKCPHGLATFTLVMTRLDYYATIQNNLSITHQLTKSRWDGTWYGTLWLVIDCQIANAWRWRKPYRSERATAPKCAVPPSRSAGPPDHIHTRTAAVITVSGPSRRGCGLKYAFGKRSRVTVGAEASRLPGTTTRRLRAGESGSLGSSSRSPEFWRCLATIHCIGSTRSPISFPLKSRTDLASLEELFVGGWITCT